MPILRGKLRRILSLHTYSDTSPQTSPAKLRQQKFANKILPVICIWQINMLPLWALTQTCMLIGMNLATIEHKGQLQNFTLTSFCRKFGLRNVTFKNNKYDQPWNVGILDAVYTPLKNNISGCLRHKDYHLGEKTTKQNAPGLKFTCSPTCILFVYIYTHTQHHVCVCKSHTIHYLVIAYSDVAVKSWQFSRINEPRD